MGKMWGCKKQQRTETKDKDKQEAGLYPKRARVGLAHVAEDMDEAQGKGDTLLKHIVDVLEMSGDDLQVIQLFYSFSSMVYSPLSFLSQGTTSRVFLYFMSLSSMVYFPFYCYCSYLCLFGR